MTRPLQMTSEGLSALKGWPSIYAVDFSAPFAGDLTGVRVPEGAVVHLDSNGKYILGVGNLAVMPLFTLQASDSGDVAVQGVNPAAKGAFVPVTPSGNVQALVAVGAYELLSTNYKTGVTYAQNTHLTSAVSGADAGKLAPGTAYIDTICGVVSRGLINNGYGHTALAFWPYYLPALSAETLEEISGNP